MKFTHSWALENFRFTFPDLCYIQDALSELGYKLPDTPPEDIVVKRIEYILSKISDAWDDKKCPWFLLLSSDPNILHTCSQILPVSFALSTRLKVCNSSVDQMMRLFFSDTVTDPFDLDPVGDTLNRIKNTGMLILDGVDEKHAGANKYTSKFSSLLNYRAIEQAPTIFTCVYDGKDDAIWETLKQRINENLGSTPAITIGRYADIVHIKPTTFHKPAINPVG